MLARELFRKLPTFTEDGVDYDPADIEDVLTADLVSAARVLPRQLVLLPLLHRLKRAVDDAPLPDDLFASLHADPEALEFALWPTVETPGLGWAFDADSKAYRPIVSTEPDFVLSACDGRGSVPAGGAPRLLLVAECKWKGSELGADVSQLARQAVHGLELERKLAAQGIPACFVHLVLTPCRRAPDVFLPERTSCPRTGKPVIISGDPKGTIEEYFAVYWQLLDEIRGNPADRMADRYREAARRVFYLSWRSVAEVLEAAQERIHALLPESSTTPREISDVVSGMTRLADEAVDVIVGMRGLEGFRGFGALDGCPTMPISGGRPLFFEPTGVR